MDHLASYRRGPVTGPAWYWYSLGRERANVTAYLAEARIKKLAGAYPGTIGFYVRMARFHHKALVQLVKRKGEFAYE